MSAERAAALLAAQLPLDKRVLIEPGLGLVHCQQSPGGPWLAPASAP